MNVMHRRDFLKLTGLALASGLLLPGYRILENGAQLFSDPQIHFGRRLMRGTAHGTILASSDEGNTWDRLASFGEQHAILQLAQKDGQVYAQLCLGNHDFWLRSTDGQRWFTV